MKFFQNIIKKFTGRPVDWDELEENLIRSDIGVPMTLRIMEALQKRAATTTITANDIIEVAREEIMRILPLGAGADAPVAGETESDSHCRCEWNRQDNIDGKAGAVFQKESAQRDARCGRYLSRGRDRAARDLGGASRCRNDPRPIQRRSGSALLRSVSGGGQAQHRVSSLRHGRTFAHEERISWRS